ncbi:sugar nucleotide-binding protein [candidate division WWE3 bacterium]|uniref:Sugar nucleotide-binding protein n=1 Tax=candidate division WWE3 bacterium TaxID=2053526 RepID=A0A955RSB2_UNCKA|nr:sugar nucleotide-binding protein [candidate division WWE3 bacterium]
MTKVLLSGGTSFLGLKFVELFHDKYEISSFSKHDLNNPIGLRDQETMRGLFDSIGPDVVVHLAASVDVNDPNLAETNIIGTKNLLELAAKSETPFVFMSSESVYGGNREGEDEISEDRELNPKTEYARSKAESERLIVTAEIPYLILRGHRFVGFVRGYEKPKQFLDTIRSIVRGDEVHLDSQKLFRPSLINHLAAVIDHYISDDRTSQRVLNCVVEHNVNYYRLIVGVARRLGLSQDVIFSDGEEKAWSDRSLLSITSLKELKYPTVSYEEMLVQLETDYKMIT